MTFVVISKRSIQLTASKMPNPIKEFFEKKKAQAKFKVAGPGQKLGDAASNAERDSARRRADAAEAAARHRAAGAAGQPHAGSSRSAAQQQVKIVIAYMCNYRSYYQTSAD